MKKAENKAKALEAMGNKTDKGEEGKKVAPPKAEPKKSAAELKKIRDINEKHKFVFEFLDIVHDQCDE